MPEEISTLYTNLVTNILNYANLFIELEINFHFMKHIEITDENIIFNTCIGFTFLK